MAAETAKYRTWRKDFEARRRKFEAQRDKFEEEKSRFEARNLSAAVTQHFDITLKDGTRRSARLLATSREHDLALLKLDNHTTPHLEAAPAAEASQGRRVYAIGSPLGLRDSVSAGVISGYRKGFLQTDASIYPGNSGGPLITEEGAVVGISTFKILTDNYEGLGFAIPIGTALKEFDLGR